MGETRVRGEGCSSSYPAPRHHRIEQTDSSSYTPRAYSVRSRPRLGKRMALGSWKSRLHHRRRAALVGATSLMTLSTLVAIADGATHTWNGSTASWSDSANWLGGLPPSGTSTDLLFSNLGSTTSTNDIAGSLIFNSLTFQLG